MTFFPGVLLKYQWTFIESFSWFNITLLTIASTMDTTGRTLGAWKQVIPRSFYLPSSITRGIVFSSLFLCLYYQVAVNFFGTDAFLIIYLVFLQLTLGYLTVLGFRFGTVEGTGDRETAGLIMGFSLTLGLTSGTTIAEFAFSKH